MASTTRSADSPPSGLTDDCLRIIEARHHDPFAVLGKHRQGDEEVIRAFLPGAAEVSLADGGKPFTRLSGTDLFEWRGPAGEVPDRYQLNWHDGHGQLITVWDPYCFPPQLPDFDLHLFAEGKHWHAYRLLGARTHTADGVEGTLFAVWAPNAERVSVVCTANQWDGRRHPMRVRGGSGVWELFIPGIGNDELYKFEIRNRAFGTIHLKSDPYGRRFELRPGTAAMVPADSPYHWQDADWLARRGTWNWQHEPISVYEVHLGSWQRNEQGGFFTYGELAERLVPYVKSLGFTHLELLPVTEHPLDESWGYQITGYYAPTSRFGAPNEFRFFVDYCHQHGLGVIIDWAPGHFPRDAHALARFDGSPLYEHEDPRRGEHRDWGTLIYNYGRNEVRNFLISNAMYWLEEFHIDGLRVDAVASMLYLDYSRNRDDWLPNVYGGRENLEAIQFLKELNEVTHGQHPGSVIVAEESTAWPQVTRPVWSGGLGFSMKWNMGWMHDTLQYMSKDPVHRKHHHNDLTFGLLYAFTENFMLPFSHDEVVHGKRSLLHRMPGDDWQQFANLRLLYTYMFTYPGKKLLFMGSEFAQRWEWDCNASLSWDLLQYPPHQGVHSLIRDLNHLYRDCEALHRHDFSVEGFEWLDCDDAANSILSYARQGGNQRFVVVLNFTPVPRTDFRLGVPAPGSYRERLNSDSSHYGGSNMGNQGEIMAEEVPFMGRSFSIRLTLPPLGGIVLEIKD